MSKTAVITGISGQDGIYLARLLLSKGYEVHGITLYSPHENRSSLVSKIGHSNLNVCYGDITDAGYIHKVLHEIRPDEIYNLAAQSHVAVSFDVPVATAQINALGPLRILETLRTESMKNCRFYQASSSEMFGNQPPPQNEDSPLQPCSPYGVSKVYAYHTVRLYREAYGLHASNGILFNHESPLRGPEFVTRKITRAVAAIKFGQQDHLALGNLDAVRDWGHAEDYVRGMWMMLQQDEASDYVLGTGVTHSVREFVEAAFSYADIKIEWAGDGVDEIGRDSKTGQKLVIIDPAYFRPCEVNHLCADASKAKEQLGWSPERSFDELVADMMAHDIALLNQN